MSIVERIRTKSREKGLSIAHIEQEIGVSPKSIYRWDKSEPSISKVVAVANLLQVSIAWLATGQMDIPHPEPPLIKRYEKLSDFDKERVDHYIELCLSVKENKYIRHYEPIIEPYPNIVAEEAAPYMAKANDLLAILGYVAAGKPIEGISTPLGYTTPPVNGADYVLIAKGSSMEPVIHDGEYIFVKNSQDLNYGDIGIFYIDGDVTCKMYCPQQDTLILRSLNPDYTPFKYSLNSEQHEFKIQGKVILTAEQRQRLTQ